MHIFAASDSHGNTGLLKQAWDLCCSRYGVADAIAHLGDSYEDPVHLDRRGSMIYRVPGINHPGYRSGMLDYYEVIAPTGGLSICLVHRREDVLSSGLSVPSVLLYGHTHRSDVVCRGGVVLMNPGHLKAAVDRRQRATFGHLDWDGRVLEVAVHDAQNGDLLQFGRFARGGEDTKQIQLKEVNR
ncbi:MAG: metallophosphoesterase family protein [Fibrobacterota bacterium]